MKKIYTILITILVVILLGGSFFWFTNASKEIDEVAIWAEEQLKTLSLDEKIGQMLIISDRTPTMTENLLNTLEMTKPGGFILFSENFTTYENTLQLIQALEETATIPLIMSIDQEGGRVQRLKNLINQQVTNFPSMNELSLFGTEEKAYQVGKAIGEELRVFGVNVDFAPILDVLNTPNNVIGNRSFGNNPYLVSKFGLALAKGLKEVGVTPTYKHFPGHGSTSEDSHQELPIIEKTIEELKSNDLIPFQNAIENGAEIIMVGHLALPKITNDNVPASISSKIITELLKKDMNYQGLVITDALNMKALTNHFSEKEIIIKAINAGVDLLLMPTDPKRTIKIIKQGILDHEITEEQINDSVNKILQFKKRNITNLKLNREYLGKKEHQELIESLKKNE
ncbi:MAG: beta-N-acetylhexosaminidase [Bacilli bacterium]|jgi:beta-N-acetylhexosaminidase|nr:beta-N-acetylhexosaminidase [Bacilli bacterium]